MMNVLKRIEYTAKQILGWCYYKSIAIISLSLLPDCAFDWASFYINYPTFADWQRPRQFVNYSDKFFVKPCPFCGKQMDATDLEDALHPDRDGYWQLSCIEMGGGCGVTMYGDSEKEVVAKWNQRT